MEIENANHFTCFNGKMIPEEEITLSIHNRAFAYGDGLFETIRIANGQIQLLSLHLQRLLEGMAMLRMDVPDFFSEKYFEEKLLSLIRLNKTYHGVRVKLMVYRNEGGLYTPDENGVSFIIEAKKMEENNYILNAKGLSIDVFEELTKPVSKLSNYKTTNCLYQVIAGVHCKEHLLDDCILVNDQGNLVEGISSNLFLLLGGSIVTPPLSEGCVSGVMRAHVMDIARSLGYEVKEAILKKEDLLTADEIFLTNAINGIRWVVAYKQKRYFNTTAKKISEQLKQMVANNT